MQSRLGGLLQVLSARKRERDKTGAHRPPRWALSVPNKKGVNDRRTHSTRFIPSSRNGDMRLPGAMGKKRNDRKREMKGNFNWSQNGRHYQYRHTRIDSPFSCNATRDPVLNATAFFSGPCGFGSFAALAVVK